MLVRKKNIKRAEPKKQYTFDVYFENEKVFSCSCFVDIPAKYCTDKYKIKYRVEESFV